MNYGNDDRLIKPTLIYNFNYMFVDMIILRPPIYNDMLSFLSYTLHICGFCKYYPLRARI